jgi:hypothetical protein
VDAAQPLISYTNPLAMADVSDIASARQGLREVHARIDAALSGTAPVATAADVVAAVEAVPWKTASHYAGYQRSGAMADCYNRGLSAAKDAARRAAKGEPK